MIQTHLPSWRRDRLLWATVFLLDRIFSSLSKEFSSIPFFFRYYSFRLVFHVKLTFYQSLFQQSIAKHSDPEEEGYSEVVDAVNTMINYASHINDIKRQKDHQNENSDGRRNSEQLKVWIWLPLSSRSKQSFSKVLSRKSVMKTLSQASKSSWIKFNRFCKRGKHEKGMKSLPETKEPFDGSKTLPASLSSVK